MRFWSVILVGPPVSRFEPLGKSGMMAASAAANLSDPASLRTMLD